MERYKASTVKRKIAALKAYYHYLVYEEILEHSPFEKIQLHIRQEILLPRTIDRPILGAIFSAAYRELSTAIPKLLAGKQLEISPCLSFCSLVGYAFPSFVQSPAIT